MNDSWGFHTPPEQQAVVDAQYKKATKLAARRPLPPGVRVIHSSRPVRHLGGGAVHTVEATGPGDDVVFRKSLGGITWEGTSGQVIGMGGERYLVPHMLALAHKVSAETGDAPPLTSNEMSKDSYRLARKYLPDFIPNGARVDRTPLARGRRAQLHAGIIRARNDEQ